MNFIMLAADTEIKTMNFLSIDLSTIVFTLINTLILFLILRHFLFKPVNKILDSRKTEVEETYKKAGDAMDNAKKLEMQYSDLMSSAKEESADIIRAATLKAQSRSDEIIVQAKNEANNVMNRAGEEIEREKKRARSEIKNEISEIAVMVAEKVVGRKLTDIDQEGLIDEFIENVGDLT